MTEPINREDGEGSGDPPGIGLLLILLVLGLAYLFDKGCRVATGIGRLVGRSA